jgi:hypothetical protein
MRRFGRNTRYYKAYPLTLVKRVLDSRATELLRAVALVEYPEVFEDVRNNVCPVCGFKAKRRVALFAHMRRSECGGTIALVIRDIVDKYARARLLIDRTRYRTYTRWVIKYTGKWYSTAEEAYRALRSMDAIVVV